MNEKKQLLVGAAKKNITPTEEMMPLNFVGPVNFTKAADEVSVRVLYLENGENGVLLVNFDLAEVPYVEETEKYISEISGLSAEHIFLSAIHTHSMPFFGTIIVPPQEETEGAYRKLYEYIKVQTGQAITEAMETKCPAKMGYREGRSYINVNRDEIVDGAYTYGVNYERPSDKTLRLVRFEDMDGKIIALLINYAVHAVVTNGCMIGDDLWLGGDLPGRTESMAEETLGGIVLWTPAASADQNPRVCTNFGYDMTSPVLRTISLGETGYLILDSLVKEHVRDILRTNDSLFCAEDKAEIAVAEKKVFVRAKGTKEGDVPTIPFTLKVLRLGNLLIEGVSAEVATTVGESLCAISDTKHTMMITHMQGTSLYVPDNWEYAVGAQEVGESLIECGCAESVFMPAFAEMIEKTKA